MTLPMEDRIRTFANCREDLPYGYLRLWFCPAIQKLKTSTIVIPNGFNQKNKGSMGGGLVGGGSVGGG